MNPVSRIVNELRDRKLLPVAVLLLVAIVAVPVALSKTSPAPTPAPAAPVASGVSGAASLPSVAVRASVDPVKLHGSSHDPFNQGRTPTARHGATTAAKVRSTTGTEAQPNSGAAKQGTGGGTATTQSTTSTTSTSTSTTTTTTSHVQVPTELTDHEAYSFSFGFTQGNGSSTIDDVERLAPLPSSKQPLLLPLGVLEGGQRVLFAVLPGAVVSGPGRCVPGPLDCQVLILSPDQIENLDEQIGGAAVQVTQFAATAVSISHFPSAATAARARGRLSAGGRQLLAQADLPAVSLFPFDLRLGALRDERNLSAGGS